MRYRLDRQAGLPMMRAALLLGLILLCIVATILATMRAVWASITNQRRAWLIIKMFDRLANVAANDDSGELISTRAYIARVNGKRWGILLANALDKIDPGHCLSSFKTDVLRK